MKKVMAYICMALVLLLDLQAAPSMLVKKETPWEFDEFLQKCNRQELITLAQSLGYLPDIQKSAYGKLVIKRYFFFTKLKLESYDSYADSVSESAETGKPIRPKTYNEIPAELVSKAMDLGYLDKSLISHLKIKKELIWNCSHWATYGFKSNVVNYGEIVDWVAKKKDIDANCISQLSTSQLSEGIAKMYYEDQFKLMWDNMNYDQRLAFLSKMEKEHGMSLNNKAAIATGASGAAIAALSTTIAVSGFAFYTTMSTAICATAACVGVTLPFSAYMAASGTAATIGGPVGWCVAGTMILATPFLFGWAKPDVVARFVVTKYFIEESWRMGK